MSIFIKTLSDKILSVIFLVIFSPLIIIISILIKTTSPGPIIFKQKRVGKNGMLFEMYKFRSMKPRVLSASHKEFARKHILGTLTPKENKGGLYKLENDERITGIGRFIRAYGLDEIPQFVNVLKGEMSVVGPRPAIPYEIQWYKPWMKKRFMCTPGITGLWQIYGRNRLKFDEGMKLDLKYIAEWSFRLDFEIMFKTAWVLLFKRER